MRKDIVCVESPDFFISAMERIAAAEGDRVYVLSHDTRHYGRAQHLDLDVRQPMEEVATAVKLAGVRPDAVFTSQEMFLSQAAALAQAFGVSRSPLDAVIAGRDKARMKEAWRTGGVRTPRSTFCASAREVAALRDEVSYPVIVKPNLGYASCGVRKVSSPGELADQVRNIALVNATVVAKEGLPGAGLLVEEYVDGPEFSVDTVWFDGQPLCDGVLSKGTMKGPYFPDRLYYHDPQLPPGLSGEIKTLSHRAVRAVGITHGATHTEIRCRGDELFVLETTNRPGAGGLFYNLFERATGVDFYRAYYLAAVCKDAKDLHARLDLCPRRATGPGEYAFWYNIPHRESGLIKEIRGVTELRARPEIDMCLCYKQPGAMLYPDGLSADYFCSVLGTYRPDRDTPSIEEFVTRYDDALEVVL